MEGVGARLGRSSTRYGPATVFSGPVRKWKKRWIHITPSSSNNNNNSNNHGNNNNHHSHSHLSHAAASTSNGTSSNGNNGSHLLLYKWTPLSGNNGASTNNNNNNDNADKIPVSVKDDDAPPQEPPRRKFKYIPVDLLEKQEKEAEKVEDDVKVSDNGPTGEEKNPKNECFYEKPDINDVPMEENEFPDGNKVVRQDLNESTLDLSLGLKSHDGESESNDKLERRNSSSPGRT